MLDEILPELSSDLVHSAAPRPVGALHAALLEERERRLAAEAEAARLRQMVSVPEYNPNPVLGLNAQGELQYANPAAGALVRELEGAGPSHLRPQLRQAARTALASGETGQLEIRSAGRTFLLAAVPIATAGYVLLYLTDISARRRAEEQVREQREFYETVLAHMPAVVAVLDPDQRYRYLNTYTEPDPSRRPDWQGRTFDEFVAERGLPRALAARRARLFRRAITGRRTVEWQERWPAQPDRNEGVLHWLCYYQPVFGPDGELRHMNYYSLDITSRQEAEERSRRSEAAQAEQREFVRQVVDTNPSYIYVLDDEGQLVFENQAMRELRAASYLGRPAPGTPSEQEDAHYAAANARVLGTGRQVTVEDPLTLQTGELRWFQTVKRPLRRPDGRVQILGVSTDITELKAAQHAAEAAALARQNFLANVSHEIRTPLNGVLGMAGLLAGTPLTRQQRAWLRVVQSSGRHLLAVLNDVLDMAKITSGKLELERIAFDLPSTLRTAAQTLAVRANEQGVHLTVEMSGLPARSSWVLGDPFRLTQVLLNLLSNAIKFTPAGGTVTLAAELRARSRQQLRVWLAVVDTGEGIAPERQELVFDSFAQAYASTTRQHGGTGLGLSISRGLVEQLGGQLLLSSTPGEGSTFAFTLALPRTTAAPPAPRQAPALPSPAAARHALRERRLLLVEDNAVNRELARLLLERQGARVDEAADGPTALALFDQHVYDAVLMDIQMPGMNGLEATAALRQHPDPARAATPVLALTANAFRADADRYRAAGLDDTLAKPFEEAELVARLAALLHRADAAAGPDGPPPAPQAAAAPLVDIPAPTAPYVQPAIFDLTELRRTAHGSEAFVQRILDTFRANTPGAVQELQAAQAAADLPAAAAVAHRLRPSLKLLGAGRIGPLLPVLENPEAPETERLTALAGLLHELPVLLAALATG